MADQEVEIGTLRWLVTIYKRNQTPDSGTGIAETLVSVGTAHANIEASRPLTFYGSEQVDRPVTHMITMRWTPFLDTTHAITRQTNLPDGTIRIETFRIRRIMELAGRKRFMRLECELEDAA